MDQSKLKAYGTRAGMLIAGIASVAGMYADIFENFSIARGIILFFGVSLFLVFCWFEPWSKERLEKWIPSIVLRLCLVFSLVLFAGMAISGLVGSNLGRESATNTYEGEITESRSRAETLRIQNVGLRDQITAAERLYQGQIASLKNRLSQRASVEKPTVVQGGPTIHQRDDNTNIFNPKHVAINQGQDARHLSSASRSKIIAYLSNHPKGAATLDSIMGDVEGTNFRDELKEVLEIAGWEVSTATGIYPDKNPVGLRILTNRKGGSAQILGQALHNAKVDVQGFYNPEWQDTIQVIVGVNPSNL